MRFGTMNSGRLPRAGFRALGALGALACLPGCLGDDGVVDPGGDSDKPVLARFQGQISTTPDTSQPGLAFDNNRLLDFGMPQVGLIWEFVGTNVEGARPGNQVISLTAPYKFSMEILDLPPPEVVHSREPVFGHFWLYSDRNGNGRLDRIVHPEVAARMRVVDSLRDLWVAAEKAFQASAVELPSLTPRADTFHLDGMGTLSLVSGGRQTVLFKGQSASDTGAWNEILFRRFRVLRNNSNWENFFALRKRAHEYSLARIPLPDRAYRLILETWIRMAPKPGREAEFEAALQAATMTFLARNLALATLKRESLRQGWADYPYDGYSEPGEDWVAGRSRWYHVLYFPDSASLEVAVEAEKSGSFQVAGLERVHRGYNLLKCDDQYRCRVLGPDDSVFIDLGMKEAFFDQPASPLATPVAPEAFEPKAVAGPLLERLAAGFRYRTYGPVTTLARGGRLWADIPRMGFFQLVAADSLVYYVPGRDLQLEFVLDAAGGPYKLMLYTGGERLIATREDSLARGDEARAKADSVLALPRDRFPDSLLAGLPAAFGYGPDTLRAEYPPGGDSLVWRLRKLPPQAFHPLDGERAVSPHTGDRIEFLRNEEGMVTGVLLTNGVVAHFLPSLEYRPRLPADLFPGGPEVDSLVSASEGSGTDSYRGLAGGKRYGCGGDGAFLRPGDGWVAGLGKGETGDSISLAAGGDGLVLRLEGLSGKRAAVEFRVCRESAGPAERRLMLGLRGRRDASAEWETLAEPHWVHLASAGDTLTYGTFPVPSDRYEVELYRAATPDPDFYFAFDGYGVATD